MTNLLEIRKHVGEAICLKIVQNDTILGQFTGFLERKDGKYLISSYNNGEKDFFYLDLTRLTIKDDYWMVDLGYNYTNMG